MGVRLAQLGPYCEISVLFFYRIPLFPPFTCSKRGHGAAAAFTKANRWLQHLEAAGLPGSDGPAVPAPRSCGQAGDWIFSLSSGVRSEQAKGILRPAADRMCEDSEEQRAPALHKSRGAKFYQGGITFRAVSSCHLSPSLKCTDLLLLSPWDLEDAGERPLVFKSGTVHCNPPSPAVLRYDA